MRRAKCGIRNAYTSGRSLPCSLLSVLRCLAFRIPHSALCIHPGSGKPSRPRHPAGHPDLDAEPAQGGEDQPAPDLAAGRGVARGDPAPAGRRGRARRRAASPRRACGLGRVEPRGVGLARVGGDQGIGGAARAGSASSGDRRPARPCRRSGPAPTRPTATAGTRTVVPSGVSSGRVVPGGTATPGRSNAIGSPGRTTAGPTGPAPRWRISSWARGRSRG